VLASSFPASGGGHMGELCAEAAFRPTFLSQPGTARVRSCSTCFARFSERLEAAIAPALFEPDLLARANVLSLFPALVLQGLELVTVGAKPKRNSIPLTVRLGKRDWHTSFLQDTSIVSTLSRRNRA
jgi:hypothetical protein